MQTIQSEHQKVIVSVRPDTNIAKSMYEGRNILAPLTIK